MRVIVERLVRRLDYETVAEHIPEADRKLLTHIRKEQQRKQRKGGQSEEGSQVPTSSTPAKTSIIFAGRAIQILLSDYLEFNPVLYPELVAEGAALAICNASPGDCMGTSEGLSGGKLAHGRKRCLSSWGCPLQSVSNGAS